MKRPSYRSVVLAVPIALLVTLLVDGSAYGEGVREAIRFAPGASSATLRGSVIRGDTDRYELGARKDQAMTVRITAEEDNAAFTIYQPGAVVKREDGMSFLEGPTLAGAGEGEDATTWSGKLPASGNYVIEVGGTRGNASYEMTVTIQ